MSVYYSWKIFNDKEIEFKDCLLLGIVSAIGFLSKYLFLYLLISIDLLFFYFIFYKKKIKFNFKYIIILEIFIVLLIPHLIWLHDNEYKTISYGLMRTGFENSSSFDHIKFPIIFILKQIGLLIPFLILVLLSIKKLRFKFNFDDRKLIFLVFINFIPIILMLATSIITGSRIRTMWMTPFYLFFGVFFVYILQSQIDLKKIKFFLYSFLFLFFLSPSLYSYISISKIDKRTDYEGKEIATLIERRWDKNFYNSIMYVIGDEWYAGNLSYHLPSRPKWYLDIKDKTNELSPNGGIIYVGNPEILKEICPGDFGKIDQHGYCMIGLKY
tara:strand:- start:864 stop:1844 length:981 start_codon:yes stop_codon:yes gene_type:complete